MGGMEQKSRVVRPRNGMNQHKRSIICISAVILLLAAVVIMSSVSLSAKNKSYIAQEKELKAFLDKEGIVIQAWYPLGHGDKALIQEPLFTEFGKKYGKSNAQIILRWHIQAGNIVIPGSKNPAHIKDNFNLFDFALTDDEMAKITALDKQKRYYTSTPEMLKKYAEMVPPVDEQK